MPTAASGSFKKVLNFDGASTYTDISLTVQALNSTAVNVLDTASHYLYFGHGEKFDLAIFDLAVNGSLGDLTWEYYSTEDTDWRAFTPSVDREDEDGEPYSFGEDGAEVFPYQFLGADWGTVAVDSNTLYWVRVTAASVATIPTVRRVQMRPLNSYTTTQEVFNFLQLEGVYSTPAATVTDFTSSTIPSKSSVEAYISGAQSEIDFKTRKSWRTNFVYNETHEFDYNGIKLDRRGVRRMFKAEIWNGSEFELLAEGRQNEYYFDKDTGMIHFSRYFFLPARFGASSALSSRFGGGEFLKPIRVSYQYGTNVNLDQQQGGYVHELARKLSAVAIVRNSDFGNIAVGGMDRVSLSEKVSGWHSEAQDALESLRAVEVF